MDGDGVRVRGGAGVEKLFGCLLYFKMKRCAFLLACEVINVGKSWIKDVNPDTLAGGPVRDSGLQGLDYS